MLHTLPKVKTSLVPASNITPWSCLVPALILLRDREWGHHCVTYDAEIPRTPNHYHIYSMLHQSLKKKKEYADAVAASASRSPVGLTR